ncbi:MAG: hypothetical protein GF398_20050 [Chitinivibrionales bacterium]|nr:hypothetical protein [Chitinivibrionales bacterium]
MKLPSIIAVLLAAFNLNAYSQSSTWAFEPDEDAFSPDALLDLSYLNEAEAGQSGFVGVDSAGDFILGNGKPVRFWCMGDSYSRPQNPDRTPRTMQEMEHHAKWLAKRGVNMIRFHGHFNPGKDDDPHSINAAEREACWKLVAGMKKAGIYTTVSPYYVLSCRPGTDWNIDGYVDKQPFSILFFNETLIGYYKQWLRRVFTTTNPHTGIALRDDPAVAIIQIQNEDSFLFWTEQDIAAPQRKILGRQFGEWLVDKYGSLNAASQAWDGNSMTEDDFAGGDVGLYKIWDMTQERSGGKQKRLADQLQFYTETMYNFNTEIARYLKEDLQCSQLVNAGNWKTASAVKLLDCERYSYSANDVIAKNHYFSGTHQSPGETQGWAIVNGDTFTQKSVLRHPRQFPGNFKQVKGYPHIITETLWVPPMNYHSEAPFLAAVYQSLTGVDGFYWFNTGEKEWRHPSKANGYMPSIGKWVCTTPHLMGCFPASALMYRRSYIARGEPVVIERRSLNDLWQRNDPIIAEDAGYDPNRDITPPPGSNITAGVNPFAYLVGPVLVEYDADPSQSRVTDMSSYIDTAGKMITSITKQIELDYENGICLLDAPQAQGAAGFLKAKGAIQLSTVRITCANDYATITVASLDGQKLTEADYVLVQAGTTNRPTDWEAKAADVNGKAGFEIVNYGKAPWQVVNTGATVGIRNASLTRAVVLDMNGNARHSLDLTKNGDYQELKLPEDAIYTVFRNPNATLSYTTAVANAPSQHFGVTLPGIGLVTFSGIRNVSKVELLDMNGRTIASRPVNSGKVEFASGSQLPFGRNAILLLRAQTSAGVRYRKLVTVK